MALERAPVVVQPLVIAIPLIRFNRERIRRVRGTLMMSMYLARDCLVNPQFEYTYVYGIA